MASCATRSECSCSSATCWRPCGCRRWWQTSATVWQAGKWRTNWHHNNLEFGTWTKHKARPSCVSCCSLGPTQSTHHVWRQKLSTRWAWIPHAQPIPSPLRQNPPSCAGQCSVEAPIGRSWLLKAAGCRGLTRGLQCLYKSWLAPCWRCPLRKGAQAISSGSPRWHGASLNK